MSQLLAELFRYTSLDVFHAIALCLMTDCRYSRRTCRLVWTAEGAVNILLILVLYLLPPLGINDGPLLIFSLLSMISYGVVYMFLSKQPWQRALFLFATYAAVFLFSVGISFSLFQLFFPDRDILFTVLRTAFLAAYILLLLWILRPAFLRATVDITEGWGTMAAMAVSTLAVICLSIADFALPDFDPLRWLMVQALMLALVAAEYAAILRMMDLLSRQQAARAAEAQRKLLESQLAAEREFVARARAYRHDARHHAALLTDYLKREDTAGAKEYLCQYIAELDADMLESYCVNPVADALLRLTARRCREEGIACTIHAAIPEKMSLTGPELAVVLGNILENAWEAAKVCRDPRLAVTTRQRGASLLIEVENTVDRPSRFEGDLPVTTKPGGGQGLRSVQRTLEKHGGMLRCSRKGDTFCTQVVISL